MSSSFVAVTEKVSFLKSGKNHSDTVSVLTSSHQSFKFVPLIKSSRVDFA